MVEEFDDGYTCNQLFCLSVFFVFLPSSCLLVFLSSCLVSGQVFVRQLGFVDFIFLSFLSFFYSLPVILLVF